MAKTEKRRKLTREERSKDKQEREERLKGNVVEHWEKGGKKKNAQVLGPGRSEARSEMRLMRLRLRREGVDGFTGMAKHVSRFTKPTLGKRRGIRRLKNRDARRARRLNRTR